MVDYFLFWGRVEAAYRLSQFSTRSPGTFPRTDLPAAKRTISHDPDELLAQYQTQQAEIWALRNPLRDVLGALTGDAGLTVAEVGKIDMFPVHAYVTIRKASTKRALQQLQQGKIQGKTWKVRLL